MTNAIWSTGDQEAVYVLAYRVENEIAEVQPLSGAADGRPWIDANYQHVTFASVRPWGVAGLVTDGVEIMVESVRADCQVRIALGDGTEWDERILALPAGAPVPENVPDPPIQVVFPGDGEP